MIHGIDRGGCKNEECVWVTHILSIEVCISTKEWQGVKMEWR